MWKIPTCTSTSADAYGITYMYMYRTAVHNWMLNSLFLEMATLNALRFCTILHMLLSCELCLRLKFRARSDLQHELCNNLTFWWYSGLCLKITNLEKMSRLQKSMQITQHANITKE